MTQGERITSIDQGLHRQRTEQNQMFLWIKGGAIGAYFLVFLWKFFGHLRWNPFSLMSVAILLVLVAYGSTLWGLFSLYRKSQSSETFFVFTEPRKPIANILILLPLVPQIIDINDRIFPSFLFQNFPGLSPETIFWLAWVIIPLGALALASKALPSAFIFNLQEKSITKLDLGILYPFLAKKIFYGPNHQIKIVRTDIRTNGRVTGHFFSLVFSEKIMESTIDSDAGFWDREVALLHEKTGIQLISTMSMLTPTSTYR